MPISLVWPNKIASRRILRLQGDRMILFPGKSFIHPNITSIPKFCVLMKSTFWMRQKNNHLLVYIIILIIFDKLLVLSVDLVIVNSFQ